MRLSDLPCIGRITVYLVVPVGLLPQLFMPFGGVPEMHFWLVSLLWSLLYGIYIGSVLSGIFLESFKQKMAKTKSFELFESVWANTTLVEWKTNVPEKKKQGAFSTSGGCRSLHGVCWQSLFGIFTHLPGFHSKDNDVISLCGHLRFFPQLKLQLQQDWLDIWNARTIHSVLAAYNLKVHNT